jgi:hypothetical protein
MNPKLKLGNPAVGGSLALHIDSSLETSSNSRRHPLPPVTPLAPTAPPSIFDKPHERSTHIDPGVLLPGLVDDLEDVHNAWNNEQGVIDVLELLKKSTKAVRSVRNYILALPSESAGVIKAEYWSKYLPPPTSKGKKGKEDTRMAPEDPLRMVRAWALKVLESLRLLEERARLPVADAAYDEENLRPVSQTLSSSPGLSPSSTPYTSSSATLPPSSPPSTPAPLSFSLMKVQVGGREESVPVWEEYEPDGWSDDEDSTEPQTSRNMWDSQLVLGSGWLYRSDLTLSDVPQERQAIQGYLDVVDRVLFHNSDDEERGWLKEKKRLGRKPRKSASYDGQMESFVFPRPEESAIHEEDEEEEDGVEKNDDELPDWAKRSLFVDTPYGTYFKFLPSTPIDD